MLTLRSACSGASKSVSCIVLPRGGGCVSFAGFISWRWLRFSRADHRLLSLVCFVFMKGRRSRDGTCEPRLTPPRRIEMQKLKNPSPMRSVTSARHVEQVERAAANSSVACSVAEAHGEEHALQRDRVLRAVQRGAEAREHAVYV